MPPSKRSELIDAATRAFDRGGYHATGIEAVLSEAGVSRMTLYNHFDSKDDLIVACLKRRDESFHSDLKRYVERACDDPTERVLAVFDYLGEWFASRSFHGCMFINASGEFHDPNSEIRAVVRRNKIDLEAFFRTLCEKAKIANHATVARQLNVIAQGAIVIASTIDHTPSDDRREAHASKDARDAAESILRRALSP